MKKHPGRQRRLDESKVEMRKAAAVKVLEAERPPTRAERLQTAIDNFQKLEEPDVF